MIRRQDSHRAALIRQVLLGANTDALVCALPANVLMLSGYCPVVGNSIAIATPESVMLLVPKDEAKLAEAGWANEIRTFDNGSLENLQSLTQAVRPVLESALHALKLGGGLVGYEQGPWVQPAPYVAMSVYGASLPPLLADCLPAAKCIAADDLLKRLQLVKTPSEIAQIRHACRVAAGAFVDGTGHVRPGITESRLAWHFQSALMQSIESDRAAGYAFCMSGPNAAEAYKAYQRSSQRELRRGDLVLVHCNSTVGGFWTDITRTYCLGPPDARQRRMYEAVFEARRGALDAVRPGVRAADVDRAARSVLSAHGFGKEFKHPTGHGVGFSAIDHDALPRLHPLSQETIEVGMVFNIEPAIYFAGQCGLRHCEMAAVTEAGAELLTSFEDRLDHLIID